MAAANKISVIILAATISLPALAQGGGQGGPPPGQRRGPGFSQGQGGGQRNTPPGGHFGNWLRGLQGKSPEQRQKALKEDPNFKALPPDQQQRLENRLQKFNNLSPQQQQTILNRMEKWEHMTPEQRQRGRVLADRLRALPDERRPVVREQCRSLGAMQQNDRQRIMNSDQYRRTFNDDERDIIGRCLEFRDNNSETNVPSLDDDK